MNESDKPGDGWAVTERCYPSSAAVPWAILTPLRSPLKAADVTPFWSVHGQVVGKLIKPSIQRPLLNVRRHLADPLKVRRHRFLPVLDLLVVPMLVVVWLQENRLP